MLFFARINLTTPLSTVAELFRIWFYEEATKKYLWKLLFWDHNVWVWIKWVNKIYQTSSSKFSGEASAGHRVVPSREACRFSAIVYRHAATMRPRLLCCCWTPWVRPIAIYVEDPPRTEFPGAFLSSALVHLPPLLENRIRQTW